MRQESTSEASPIRPRPGRRGGERFLGIDAGAETIKLAELARTEEGLRWTRRQIVEHGKEPGRVLARLLREWNWEAYQAVAVTGRFSKQVRLPRVPTKQAQARAFRFLADDQPATIVSVGSHGFSVLELRPNGIEVFRENSRCSQGTGNFLRQLVERFSLTIEEASALAASVEHSAPLSGRCPVILKSDMTHLANKGGDRNRILAGLFDAVCENVLVLLKPGISPKRVALIGGVSRSARLQQTFREFLSRHGMTAWTAPEDEALFFEALGCALIAVESRPLEPPGGRSEAPGAKPSAGTSPPAPPTVEELLSSSAGTKLEKVPPLSASLAKVKRLTRQPPPDP